MTEILLLGPQRENPTVGGALQRIEGATRLVMVSAGWQEREGELDDLAAHLGKIRLTDLRLYARTEEIFEQDPELLQAWRDRQDWLKELQRIYRVRLRHAMAAARELEMREGIEALIRRERAHALNAIRDLDRHHLREIRKVHFEYWRRWQPAQRPAVARHREQVQAAMLDADALLIAGGNVGILLNRLRLYDIGPLLTRMPIIAWSAGAMALAERVVLFHDFAPQAPGYAEILDAGLGAYRGVVALPDARHRLVLDDPTRVEIMAGRLDPALGVALDEESILHWDGHNWHAHGPTRVFRANGVLDEISA